MGSTEVLRSDTTMKVTSGGRAWGPGLEELVVMDGSSGARSAPPWSAVPNHQEGTLEPTRRKLPKRWLTTPKSKS